MGRPVDGEDPNEGRADVEAIVGPGVGPRKIDFLKRADFDFDGFPKGRVSLEVNPDFVDSGLVRVIRGKVDSDLAFLGGPRAAVVEFLGDGEVPGKGRFAAFIRIPS